ncbi:hypothetical protein BCF59_0632 [Mycoplasmopsis mustelae]|uniref:Uncharacterized protein n=1 Tax=Mycoplasmopsis mustelae TaxID=171289 RepID=A0A4R7UC36_9BACT|nr:hypothetical protein BCF59_0632 [Mycoplasmopsis mustelae]
MKKFKINFFEYLLLLCLILLFVYFIYLILNTYIVNYKIVIIKFNDNTLRLKNITYAELQKSNYQIEFIDKEKFYQYIIKIHEVGENNEIIISNKDLESYLINHNLEFISVKLIKNRTLIYQYLFDWIVRLFR